MAKTPKDIGSSAKRVSNALLIAAREQKRKKSGALRPLRIKKNDGFQQS